MPTPIVITHAMMAYTQSMMNMSEVHSRKPARPTDQWYHRHFGRQWGSLRMSSTKQLRFMHA